ncbi:TRAP transporter subunit DctM [Escherichia coli]|nr:TRAP transporter subunit DctM [Escherichia coli]
MTKNTGRDYEEFVGAIHQSLIQAEKISHLKNITGNDSNLLIVFYVQIMPDDFVMQLHRF